MQRTVSATWLMVTRKHSSSSIVAMQLIQIHTVFVEQWAIYGRKTPKKDRKKKGRAKKKNMCYLHRHTLTYTHKLVTAGGISVRGASLNFCRVNSFQMQEFPAGPAQSRCPVCQQICLKLGTFKQSFSSHLPEGELLLIKPFHLSIFD